VYINTRRSLYKTYGRPAPSGDLDKMETPTHIPDKMETPTHVPNAKDDDHDTKSQYETPPLTLKRALAIFSLVLVFIGSQEPVSLQNNVQHFDTILTCSL
jgi:hypothetical protein